MQSTSALGMWIGNAILSKRILPMPAVFTQNPGPPETNEQNMNMIQNLQNPDAKRPRTFLDTQDPNFLSRSRMQRLSFQMRPPIGVWPVALRLSSGRAGRGRSHHQPCEVGPASSDPLTAAETVADQLSGATDRPRISSDWARSAKPVSQRPRIDEQTNSKISSG